MFLDESRASPDGRDVPQHHTSVTRLLSLYIDNAAVLQRCTVPYRVVDDRSHSSIMLIMLHGLVDLSSCDLNPAGSSCRLG